MYKLLLFVCAQALVQSISAQCIGAYNGFDFATGFGWDAVAPWASAPLIAPCADWVAPTGRYFESAWTVPFANGLGPASLAASNGRGLAVTSASPITPTGVSMTSENAYEGILAVTGAIPFLGAVALEGALPTIGGGAVTYSCGNGNVAIVAEEIAPALTVAGPIAYDGLVGPYGYAGLGPFGYDGFAGPIGYGAPCGGVWY